MAESEKVTARLFLRSGQTVVFQCDKLSVKKGPLGLQSISWEGAIDAPIYISVDDVVAVQ